MRETGADFWPAIESAIESATASGFRIAETRPVTGGCIHRSFAVSGGSVRYFVKVNDAPHADGFSAEADGLTALIAAGARAPQPVCHGRDEHHAWIVMEFLDLGGASDFARLGTELAKLHSVHGAAYGWHRSNYIGATRQSNRETRDWLGFWRDERLVPQLDLAARNGLANALARVGDQLVAALPQLLGGHTPAPSLLHGDLWGGNAGFLKGGTPVMFDPAVYRGDRETDLAMTELFGGFPERFYTAYREAAPLEEGYRVRKTLYNLYHVLNHANLFGGGYATQAEAMMRKLLAEIRR